jgi:hypothetical protein
MAKKDVDYVAYEPVMCALSKARAMTWVLDQLAPGGATNLAHALAESPEETDSWLHTVVTDALRASLDEIETEYRKLGTNLLLNEVRALTPEKAGA